MQKQNCQVRLVNCQKYHTSIHEIQIVSDVGTYKQYTDLQHSCAQSTNSRVSYMGIMFHIS